MTLRFFTCNRELLLGCESVATIDFQGKGKQTVKKGSGEDRLFGPGELHGPGSDPPKGRLIHLLPAAPGCLPAGSD